jgi:hypothetical protein
MAAVEKSGASCFGWYFSFCFTSGSLRALLRRFISTDSSVLAFAVFFATKIKWRGRTRYYEFGVSSFLDAFGVTFLAAPVIGKP